MHLECLQNRSAHVLVVEGNSSRRQTLVAVLKEAGFDHTTGVLSIDDAFQFLSSDVVDWLITPMVTDAKVNGLQLLEVAAKHKALEQLMVTFTVTPADEKYLAVAFARGLFSFMFQPANRQDFEREIQATLTRLGDLGWDSVQTSAAQLREHLSRVEKFQALAAFEKMLAQHSPEDARQLLRYAEASFKAGDKKMGRNIAWKSAQLDSELLNESRDLAQKYTQEGEFGASGEKGLGVVFVIDPDTSVQKAAHEALMDATASAVHVFDNGLAAWEQVVEKGAPHLVITEWRLPKLSGANFLQRLRAAGHHQTAVMVQSSLLDAKDEYLVREMGVDAMVKKPMRTQDFLNCLAWTISQEQEPTEVKSLETKIQRLLMTGDLAEAARLFEDYKAKTTDTSSKRIYLEALFAYHSGDGLGAKHLVINAITAGGPSLERLNLLAKTHLLLRETEAALKVFRKAHGISPRCIERLCQIAEMNAELGHEEEAKVALDEASKVDAENPAVITAKVKVGLLTGDKELVARYFEATRSKDSVLSYLNNHAVALTRRGEIEKSLATYQNALEALPGDETVFRATITYNYALAHARNREAQKSLDLLSALKVPSGHPLSRRIRALEMRVQTALRTSAPIVLNLEEHTSPPQAAASGEALALAGGEQALVKAPTPPGRSTRCCRNLLPLDVVRDAESDALVANVPRFAMRGVLRRA